MITRIRDGRAWRIGTEAEVAWITSGTAASRTITAAIPPVFEAYATVVEPASNDQWANHDRAVVAAGPVLGRPDLVAGVPRHRR